ncbi:hypothetical protein [Ferrovibrio sp.]|uniref:hypothetical protein n=1 Tax=Ferrovibrio sp. TaxID=1917215 RepID=UPI003D2CDA01
MRKFVLLLLPLLLPLLLLAACAEPAPRQPTGPSSSASPPPAPPPLAAAARIEGDWLGIRVRGPAAIESASLVDPDGRAHAASRITFPALSSSSSGETESRIGRPSVVLGGSGGSSSGIDAGIGLSLPIQNPFSSSSRPQRPPMVLSQAEFTLPPPVLARYRADMGQGWRLRLSHGGQGEILPAPAPDN